MEEEVGFEWMRGENHGSYVYGMGCEGSWIGVRLLRDCERVDLERLTWGLQEVWLAMFLDNRIG